MNHYMPVLLDLFCGAGGCSKGYVDAGFKVVGVDNKCQKNYPYEFIQADALEYVRECGHEYDVIHASPPCQAYTSIAVWKDREYPDMIAEVRESLKATGKPYIIENVPGAPLINPIMLCGTMFGLNVIRHRLFECNPEIWFPPAICNHHRQVVKHGRPPEHGKHFAAVTGHFSDVEYAKESMGINWMGQHELAQAIPPAYTKFIGEHLKKNLT